MIESWLHGRSNPAYLDERDVHAAGRAKRLQLVPE
jgi:hypothetical protein